MKREGCSRNKDAVSRMDELEWAQCGSRYGNEGQRDGWMGMHQDSLRWSLQARLLTDIKKIKVHDDSQLDYLIFLLPWCLLLPLSTGCREN
jgi:hypothetical protein